MEPSSGLRLALDIGTNSIGWALLKLDNDGAPQSVHKLGVRIFSDGRNPKDKTSLAVARRLARQMRRQRDRKIQRKKLILNALIKIGLFPAEKKDQEALKKLNVLKLRSAAVQSNNELSNFELGRVILHLSKSRGFKSGRKETSDKRDTKISGAIDELKKQLADENAKTYGDFLFQRMQKGLSTVATVAGFYPSREVVIHEFDEIVRSQQTYQKSINDSQWQYLKNIIFYQRPLRPVEVGKCSLYIEKDRAFQFMPSFEIYRLLGELYNIRWRDDKFTEIALNSDQIIKCIDELKLKKEIKYSDIRKVVGLDKNLRFTIELRAKREKIKGCPTIAFMGAPKKGLIFSKWKELSLEEQDAIAGAYFNAENAEGLVAELESLKILSREEVDTLARSDVPGFSDGTCSFSVHALREIIKHSLQDRESPLAVLFKLRKEEHAEGYSAKLQYYGKAIPDSVVPVPSFIVKHNKSLNQDEIRYGKIANPTVHIGLNQLRTVINEIIEMHGKPGEIHIEFARELKLSNDQKNNIQKMNKINEGINEKAKAFIKESGLKDTGFNMERVKLWFEMENRLECHCIYTGKKISQDMVLSEKVEVDHILPFSRTLDDGFMNKVLVTVEANRIKKNKTPFEAFGGDKETWAGILARVQGLPDAKAWRFAENAMEVFSKNNDFLARQLTDTSYLSKTAKKYLKTILPETKIVTSPGRLTALIRGKLGMNSLLSDSSEKNRNDHRHHAVDALVIGITDRSLLQKMAKASENERQRVIIDQPWSHFHETAKVALDAIVVSHKVDHGMNAAFAEQTGFGLRKPISKLQIENDFKMVTRKPLDVISDARIIVGDELRGIAEEKGVSYLSQLGVKKLRVFEVNKEKFEDIGVKDTYMVKVVHGNSNQHYVCYRKSGTYKMSIWRVPVSKDSKEAKKGEKYKLVFCYQYYFDAMKFKDDGNKLKPHPAAKLLMTLHNGDTVALERDGKLGYCQVITLSQSSNSAGFIPLNSSEGQKSSGFFKKTVNSFKEMKLRRIRITPDGRVLDGGPRL